MGFINLGLFVITSFAYLGFITDANFISLILVVSVATNLLVTLAIIMLSDSYLSLVKLVNSISYRIDRSEEELSEVEDNIIKTIREEIQSTIKGV